MKEERYPRLIINRAKLRHNIIEVKKLCDDHGIEMAGVIKGFNGIPQCTEEFAKAGVSYIGSSRLEQLQRAADFGVKTPFMLIRIPMLSEVSQVVEITDISLASDIEVLKALDGAAGQQEKIHKVILMADLGDLREGFWEEEELIAAALMVENDLKNLELAGIGTNLGCYGAIAATPEKLRQLVDLAEVIEAAIGRRLKYISGGATSSLPRLLEDNMPERVNLLRLGEGVILAKDLMDLWGYDMSFLYQDVFTLQAEVVEVRVKPSYPVGEIVVDAFGHKPEYTDKGMRKKALVALGKVDYGNCFELLPREKGIEILGASSDHTILDVEDMDRDLKVGDILEFDLCYATIVYVTSSENIKRVFIDG